MHLTWIAVLCAAVAAPARAQTDWIEPSRTQARRVSIADYFGRLHGLWLGEVIANWTGLRTEGLRQFPPFLTDEDWGSDLGHGPIEFVLDQDPWRADDDTDIEYVYTHLLDSHASHRLSAQQIREGWMQHINHHIWVSNAAARLLMGRNIHPPATGMGAVNPHGLMIDAQLTTEIFGAYSPGLPEWALENADLPVSTTAYGYAAHAAQFFIVLYSLAIDVDPLAPRPQELRSLVDRARRFLPDGSKSADIVDFVTDLYDGASDYDDWEAARDAVYERYQGNAAQHGFRYRGWFESSVNFASALIALLYGQGDYPRTVQIGTLSGWDSDNGTATMGGLLGLIYGYDYVRSSFPSIAFSDRYDVSITRDFLPDHLPADSAAEDTLELVAERGLQIAQRSILAAGGSLTSDGSHWILPSLHTTQASETLGNPGWREHLRSASLRVRAQGGTTSAASSIPGHVAGAGSGLDPTCIGDGFESNAAGAEVHLPVCTGYSSRAGGPVHPPILLSVTYDRTVEVQTIRFIEGDHDEQGGWFQAMAPLVRSNGRWITPPGGYRAPAQDPLVPFEVLDFELSVPISTEGVAVRGLAGGPHRYVTALELDGLSR